LAPTATPDQEADVTGADLVLHGGAVYTVDAARRWAQAVAVTDGRIVALGTDRQVRELSGRRTELVDLRGRMLLPGFQDAHVHAGGGGLERLRCDLSGVRSRDGYLATIRRYADANPDAAWILGGGWSMDVFPGGVPHRADLDAVIADRPVFLPNRDHHAVWVNSRALELAGVGEATPDPPHGRIERDASGRPSGVLHEAAASLVGRLVPAPTPDELRAALRIAQRHLHSFGVTAWQEAIVGEYDSVPDLYEAYRSMDAAGELTATVVGALWWDRDRGLDQLDGLLARRAGAATGRFRATHVKVMLDGVCEAFTASLRDPYVGRGGRGLDFVDPAKLPEYVTALDAAGFGVHFHAIGDRAIGSALDAVAAARERHGDRGNRHQIAHVQVVDPADVPRFHRLGVAANLQGLWACHEPQMTELTLPFLGAERAWWQYPFGGFARNGVALGFGSDWPVSIPDPLQALHVAVNRVAPDAAEGTRETEPFLPEQALDLATALAGYTIGSAYLNGLDTEIGSIEVGKRADLVVLDRDLFAAPATRLGDARTVLTLVDGRPVYESDS
jgi:predicted amidohydrolase YtcJ